MKVLLINPKFPDTYWGDLFDSVRKIQSYGIEVMAGFIVGFDNDPKDIFERQIDFIRKSSSTSYGRAPKRAAGYATVDTS
jgi:hypothetical protein